MDWEGGAVDPETGFLYVGSATRTDTAVYGLEKPKPGETDIQMIGTGSVAPTIQRLPIVKPPWTRITAINLNTGDTLWQVPNGGTPEWVKNHPLLKGVTLPQTGSVGRAPLVMVTKTLLFAGSGYETDPAFRAYDKKTGALVWEDDDAAGPADRRTDDVSVQGQAVHRRCGRGQSRVTRRDAACWRSPCRTRMPRPAAGRR